MASLDALPPDQRAVLQLVLQRGRGYDDIAGMLAIDRAAVRQRALGAFDELGPQTRVPAERRALITDYLLGQLPPRVSEQVRGRLAQSASERAWARVIAAELAPLAGGPLPEIPVETARRAADFEEDEPAERPTAAAAAPIASPPSAPREAAAPDVEESEAEEPESEPIEAAEAPDLMLDSEPAPPRARSRSPQAEETRRGGRGPRSPSGAATAPRSSRRGGVILLTLVGVAIVAGIVIAITSSGSGSNSHTSSAAGSASTGTTSAASTPSGTTGTSTPSTTTTAPRVIAQINLKPPAGTGKAAGIAEVLKQGTNTGIAIVAQGVPPNTTKPPNAYAVWLYNSSSDSRLLGFVNPGVGKNGRLSTAGGLPANASHYHQVIVTLETQNNPRTPGQVILAGALTGV